MDTGESDHISLVPHSGIQFLVYGFDVDAGPAFSRKFIERTQVDQGTENNDIPVVLLPGYNDIDPLAEPEIASQPGDQDYDISKSKALEPFIDEWVPVPFFAVRPGTGTDGLPVLARGPTNWARARVARSDKQSTGFTHRLILAFDTQLVKGDDSSAYVGLTEEDARHEQEFMLAHRFKDLGWFFLDERLDPRTNELSNIQQWVIDWIKQLFFSLKRRQRPGRVFREEDLDFNLEHVARYISFLSYISTSLILPRIKLVDTVSEEPFAKPVQVDLILDIGNSRTCGILIESFPSEDRVDLGNSMVLQLRDLTQPEVVYSEPFESHVELSQPNFGPESLSRTSGRVKAFFWPSLVRTGPEASRFREEAQGVEAASGMSSPKRYLWDTDPVLQPWKFQPRDYDDQGQPPLVEKAARVHLNARGDVLAEVTSERALYQSLMKKSDMASLEEFGLRLTASRSSFFTFMIAEVLAQTLSMINNFQIRAGRKFRDSPRRLNRLILTLPTAIPVREQRIMRSRVNAAVRLVWAMMGWENVRSTVLRPPELVVQWDEASCVQFVYLYSEIARKFGGDIGGFFDLGGRRRQFAEADEKPSPEAPQRPSLRLASVDIGGGTTDLMITTYFQEEKYAISPVQTFRESFRVAGDDLLKAIIEQAVLPHFKRQLATLGVASAGEVISNRFGGNRANMSEQDKHLRQQFVLRVLRPIAIELLRSFEAADFAAQETTLVKKLGLIFEEGMLAPASGRVKGYISEALPDSIKQKFKIEDVEIEYNYSQISDAIISVLDGVFNNIASALHHFDCDLVLLAGRPSRLPAVVDLLLNKLALAPDRVVPLHEYPVGAWYPFKTKDNVRIADPKTATVVGGMLCALAERKIMNLTIYTERLTLKSTARFIGQLESDASLPVENVLFGPTQPGRETEAEVRYVAPMRLGYRQLPLRNWTANPLYRLSVHPDRRIRQPITVVLARGAPDKDASFEEINRFQVSEALKEEVRVVEAFDADGASLTKTTQLDLDTMAADDGYWLDTGILTTS